MYIASLMGHWEVVGVLLENFAAKNTQWWLSSRYSDGWTPLMAVAVSNHVAVAKKLLDAAEAQSPGAGVALALARNQYG